MKHWMTAALLLLTGFSLQAANIDPAVIPPYATIPQMKQAPVIDGMLQKHELTQRPGMYGFCRLASGMKLLPADAWYQVGTDGKTLYISVQCEVGPDGILQRARSGRGGQRAFMDDSFEFVIVPDPHAKIPDIYHLITNNKGSYMTTARKNNANVAWNPEFSSKGIVKDGMWTYEIALPLSSIGLGSLKENQEFGVRVCRNWRRMLKGYGGDWGCQSAWSQLRGAFFDSASIPVIRFSSEAPVVRFLSVKDKKGNPDLKVSIYNPSAKTVTLKTVYSHRPSNSQSIAEEKKITLKAGETTIASLPTAQITDGETVTTSYLVLSADGKQTIYRRTFFWKLGRPQIFASSKNSEKDKIGFKFAYYPESDKMFVQLDFSAVDASRIKKISGMILDKTGKQVTSFALSPANRNISETLLSLPSLKAVTKQRNPSGEYILKIKVDGIANAELSRTFERNAFDWEGNKLGRSNCLVPPFTAVKVKDNTVSTILREHQLNSLGLWKQVKAAGENLLADDGIYLEAVINGKTYRAKGDALKFTKKDALKTIAESTWQAGALCGKGISDFDFDGMMKYTMTLAPCTQKIDSLKLVIPVKSEQGYLFHACTDGLRFNYGGATPKGEGKIWDSGKASRSDLQTTYVPYIFLGTEERGISVFGDSDKGWSLEKKSIAQELIRKNGRLYLILNLFSKPAEIKTPRTIELGFQAMPIKPMPKNWRKKFAAWGTPGNVRPYLDYSLNFLGSSLCRGGVSSSDDLAPRDNDLTAWKVFGEVRRSKVIPKDFLDQWCAGYRDKTHLKSYRAEMNYGLSVMKGAPKGTVTFYTNARGIRTDIPETRTFQDNWLREEFQGNRVPAYGSSKSYSVDPVESFRDYAVTWYNKMITSGACDNIYWDDIFLASNFDRSGGSDAFIMEDGSFQPSVGLFNMRELIKRTAHMQMEIGRKPFNMVHMTNTAIAPLLSFAQQNLDWEDNLGTNPFQQRYTREYIRTLSIGRQFGNLPAALGLVNNAGGKPVMEHCLRTGAGVTLTHEIQWAKGSAAKDYWENMLELYKFGYGNDDLVKVRNYWEKNYPVKIAGGDNASLLLVKGKDAILIVCDYDNGGKFEVSFDMKQLGWSGIVQAKNNETGSALTLKDGKIQFQLKKYDFITIRLQAK